MKPNPLNKFPIPEDLGSIIKEFSREVNREKPQDILDFAVEYFRAKEENIPFKYIPLKPGEKREYEIKKLEKKESKDSSKRPPSSNSVSKQSNYNESHSEMSSVGGKNAKHFIGNIIRDSMKDISQMENMEKILKSNLTEKNDKSEKSEKSISKKSSITENKENEDNFMNPILDLNKKTKIVATIGPASNSPETIKKLYEVGVNVFRLNFSHGTHESHGKIIDLIKSLKLNAAIMLDTRN